MCLLRIHYIFFTILCIKALYLERLARQMEKFVHAQSACIRHNFKLGTISTGQKSYLLKQTKNLFQSVHCDDYRIVVFLTITK
jgi:hypothetical protein